jgi:hypothetical protein
LSGRGGSGATIMLDISATGEEISGRPAGGGRMSAEAIIADIVAALDLPAGARIEQRVR